MLNKAKLPEVNRVQETGRTVNNINFNSIENKYSTLNLNNILTGKLNLDKFLNKLYPLGESGGVLKGGAAPTNVNNKLLPLASSQMKLAGGPKGATSLRTALLTAAKQPQTSFSGIRSLKGTSSLKKKAGVLKKTKLYNSVFNSIKYKNLHGIRMEVKGRLTPRYRADRSVYKVKWKGGLKNVGSSYKGLAVRKFRGHLNPNVSYSIFASKRRVGAFAVKGWTGGKF